MLEAPPAVEDGLDPAIRQLETAMDKLSADSGEALAWWAFVGKAITKALWHLCARAPGLSEPVMDGLRRRGWREVDAVWERAPIAGEVTMATQREAAFSVISAARDLAALIQAAAAPPATAVVEPPVVDADIQDQTDDLFLEGARRQRELAAQLGQPQQQGVVWPGGVPQGLLQRQEAMAQQVPTGLPTVQQLTRDRALDAGEDAVRRGLPPFPGLAGIRSPSGSALGAIPPVFSGFPPLPGADLEASRAGGGISFELDSSGVMRVLGKSPKTPLELLKVWADYGARVAMVDPALATHVEKYRSWLNERMLEMTEIKILLEVDVCMRRLWEVPGIRFDRSELDSALAVQIARSVTRFVAPPDGGGGGRGRGRGRFGGGGRGAGAAGGPVDKACYGFNSKQGCTWGVGCKFAHVCMSCGEKGHGRTNCK